jgi:hypothetical protein
MPGTITQGPTFFDERRLRLTRRLAHTLGFAVTNGATVNPQGVRTGGSTWSLHPPTIIPTTGAASATLNKICELAEFWSNDYDPTARVGLDMAWWRQPQYMSCILGFSTSALPILPSPTQYIGASLSSPNAAPPWPTAAGVNATFASDQCLFIRANTVTGKWQLVQDNLAESLVSDLAGVNLLDVTGTFMHHVEIYYTPEQIRVDVDSETGLVLTGSNVILDTSVITSHTGASVFVCGGTNANAVIQGRFVDMYVDTFLPS